MWLILVHPDIRNDVREMSRIKLGKRFIIASWNSPINKKLCHVLYQAKA